MRNVPVLQHDRQFTADEPLPHHYAERGEADQI